MKRQEEPIIAYLKAIGCKALNTKAQAAEFIVHELGDDAEKAYEIIQAREEGAPDALDHKSFYEWKNATFTRSRAITLLYDNFFIREVGRKIQKQKDAFGSRVLDIGCDNGVLTCFLASLCPDSMVLGIDQCAGAVENARRLASNLSLSNVVFRVGDTESLGGEKFDTVFTSRTAQENFDNRPYPWEMSERGQIELISSLHSEFAAKVAKLVAPEGNLFCVSRDEFKPSYCGRMLSLVGCGFVWSPESWTEVSGRLCLMREGDFETFQIALLKRGVQSEDELLTEFCRTYRNAGVILDAKLFPGNFAAWERLIRAGRVIFGKRLVDVASGQLCGEYVLYYDREDDALVWGYLNNNAGDLYFERYSPDEIDDLKGLVQGWVDRSLEKEHGMRVEDIAIA